MSETQSYKSHRRFFPAHHYFVIPILLVNLVFHVWRFFQNQSTESGVAMLVALALLIFGFTARVMALSAQDRVIRLEERLRLMRLMPPEEHGRIDELAPRQLVGLRFASDAEVVDLARKCLSGEIRSGEDVKRNVREWRPDHLRV